MAAGGGRSQMTSVELGAWRHTQGSQAGPDQRPGDAGGNIAHNGSRWEMKWWSSEDVRELQNKEDLIRRCWIFGTQTMLFRNV